MISMYVIAAYAQSYCNNFNTCLNIATRNVENKIGKEYYKTAAIHLDKSLNGKLMKCATSKTKEQGFIVIFLLEETGTPLYTSTNSNTAYAACAISQMKGINFPRPPRGEYWLYLNMGYNPNPRPGEGEDSGI